MIGDWTPGRQKHHIHSNEGSAMKKLLVLISLILLLGGTVSSVMSAGGPSGPAPSSGDGVSEGSDLDSGPNSDAGDAPGPAPNSGDGVSDGSGF